MHKVNHRSHPTGLEIQGCFKADEVTEYLWILPRGSGGRGFVFVPLAQTSRNLLPVGDF